MADETTFLTMLAEHPGDHDARLIYADWLEGHGHAQRAKLLRLACELAQTPFSDDSLVKRSRALLAISRGVDPEWLATAVNYPRLEGTCWGTRDHDGVPYLVGFLSGGKLRFRRSPRVDDDEVVEATGGSWGQVGAAVRFDINGYSDHVGAFHERRMRGTARNKSEDTWSWHLARIDDRYLTADEFPALPAEPMDTDFKTGNSRDI